MHSMFLLCVKREMKGTKITHNPLWFLSHIFTLLRRLWFNSAAPWFTFFLMCRQSGLQLIPHIFIPMANICIVKTTIIIHFKQFHFTHSLMVDAATHSSCFLLGTSVRKMVFLGDRKHLKYLAYFPWKQFSDGASYHIGPALAKGLSML